MRSHRLRRRGQREAASPSRCRDGAAQAFRWVGDFRGLATAKLGRRPAKHSCPRSAKSLHRLNNWKINWQQRKTPQRLTGALSAKLIRIFSPAGFRLDPHHRSEFCHHMSRSSRRRSAPRRRRRHPFQRSHHHHRRSKAAEQSSRPFPWPSFRKASQCRPCRGQYN